MNIDDFFELDEKTRDYLLGLHRKRQRIRMTRDSINSELNAIKTREVNLQLDCDHVAPDKRTIAEEDEYGKRTGVSRTNYYCPDCYFRWTEEH